MQVRFVDLIDKKKRGMELSKEEIQWMISSYVNDQTPDYQMSAMLMAICFQGMSDQEISTMTLAMADSGSRMDLSKIKGVKVDKHSTGGVGDKTTLVVAPMVAAAGIPAAKMSGRGLGHTGGTIDKLESIKGFRTDLSQDDFVKAVNQVGICIAGQTSELAPADKKLYALRDVTGTVNSIPLIAASIMSKKLAAGSDKILLDVTTGSGAFLPDMEESVELARQMVAIGTAAGKETVALITNMDDPLGSAIGNRMEVKEAIDALHGKGPEDLMEVCYELAGNMIFLGHQGTITMDEAIQIGKNTIVDGSAYIKFKELVSNQGGSTEDLDDYENWENANYQENIIAKEEGYIVKMNTAQIGVASSMLGAGRTTKESKIDMLAGIYLEKKSGDYVKKGQVMGVMYSSEASSLAEAMAHFQSNYQIGKEKPQPKSLILKRIP